ncbi:hypothetical protein [Gemmatimonas sp.]|uniref:hypothetical protein n=1 Tax=Gemmatimonas sp. TaxID=1962908 RepID=UPI00398378C6
MVSLPASLPAGAAPRIGFGVVLSFGWVLVAMLRDQRSRGAVHPVLLYGGAAVIAEQTLELLAFDAPWWRAAAQLLYGWLHG